MNVQETIEAPPAEARPKIQIVPLAGLPVAAVLIGFVVYAIATNKFWPLMFCHVAGGALWTSIDLFVGLAVGPIIGSMSPPARAEFTAKFMPKMVIIMPTVVTMTLATGLPFQRWSRPTTSSSRLSAPTNCCRAPT